MAATPAIVAAPRESGALHRRRVSGWSPLMTALSPAARGLALALLGFALFAAHDALIKALGQTYSVFQILFFAMLFAFLPMSVLILSDASVGNYRPNFPLLLIIRSALMIGAMMGAFYAFSVLPLAEAYALLFAMPLVVTALSVPLLGETVRARRWAAVLIGMIGVLIVLRPGVVEISLGHMAALGAACASAAAGIVVRKIGRRERSAVLILYPTLFAILAMAALLPFVYVPVELPHLGMMALVGGFSVAAQLCIIAAFQSAPAALVAPAQYSQIIWATLYGALFFAEKPDIYVGLGAGVIILSGVFIVWREGQANVSEQNPVLGAPGPRLDTASPLRVDAAPARDRRDESPRGEPAS